MQMLCQVWIFYVECDSFQLFQNEDQSVEKYQYAGEMGQKAEIIMVFEGSYT